MASESLLNFCIELRAAGEFYLTLIQGERSYSMKQTDLYYFETIKMTSQAWSNFVWRIRATGEYSL